MKTTILQGIKHVDFKAKTQKPNLEITTRGQKNKEQENKIIL